MDVALADLFLRATLAILGGDTDEPVKLSPKESARRFLFARLDSLDGYKGMFAQNSRLPIPCGTNLYLEVDIWSERNRLAIMLDTSESMSDISLYRLARREDALLHRNGYRILRFLAEDVCERLDAVLGEIEMCSSPTPNQTT